MKPSRTVTVPIAAIPLALLCNLLIILKWNDLSVPYFWDELANAALPVRGAAAVSKWLGVGLPGMRGIFLGLHCVQLIYIYRLSAWFGGELAGMVAAVAAFALPIVFAHSTQTLADPALACLGVVALYYACRKDDIRYLVFGSIAAAMKGAAVAFALPVFVLRVWRARADGTLTKKIVLGYALPLLVIALFSRVQGGENLSLQPGAVIGRFFQWGRSFLFEFQKTGWITVSGLAGATFLFRTGTSAKRWGAVLCVLVCAAYLAEASLFTQFTPRSLLPVYPILAALAAAAAETLLGRFRGILFLVLVLWVGVAGPFKREGGSIPGYGYEDSMSYRDVTRIHEQAAVYLEERFPQARVYAVWPFDVEYKDPFYGYVEKPMRVTGEPAGYELMILSDSQASRFHPIQRDEIVKKKLVLEKRFELRGKWLEIWRVPAGKIPPRAAS